MSSDKIEEKFQLFFDTWVLLTEERRMKLTTHITRFRYLLTAIQDNKRETTEDLEWTINKIDEVYEAILDIARDVDGFNAINMEKGEELIEYVKEL